MAHSTTCLTGVLAMQLQRVAKFSMMTMALAPGVLELVLQLARVYSGFTLTTTKPGAQDGRDGDRVLRHVGHHDGDAVAAGQPRPCR